MRGAVVITGTSSGIGRATALYLDSLGFKIFAGVRREEDGDSLRRESSEGLHPVIMDVTNHDSVMGAAEIVSNSVAESGLAALVNNAGIPAGGPIEFVSIDDVRRALEVNLVGQIDVIQVFLPSLRKGRGRIVNIGSIGGILPLAFNGPYSASKAALKTMTETLSMELRPSGIKVSIVIPGNVQTAIWEKGGEGREERIKSSPPKLFEYYGEAFSNLVPFLERMRKSGMAPEQVAKVVARAITSKRPKTCYLVGSDARIQALVARFLPGRMRDLIMLRYMGLAI